MQVCQIHLPKLWWTDQVNATLQTQSRAHWTPNGISTTTCESPAPHSQLIHKQCLKIWSFNECFPTDFVVLLLLKRNNISERCQRWMLFFFLPCPIFSFIFSRFPKNGRCRNEGFSYDKGHFLCEDLTMCLFFSYIGKTDSITISIWNHKKIHKRQGAGFLGCIRLLSNAISRLKDTGCKPLQTSDFKCI